MVYLERLVILDTVDHRDNLVTVDILDNQAIQVTAVRAATLDTVAYLEQAVIRATQVSQDTLGTVVSQDTLGTAA